MSRIIVILQTFGEYLSESDESQSFRRSLGQNSRVVVRKIHWYGRVQMILMYY